MKQIKWLEKPELWEMIANGWKLEGYCEPDNCEKMLEWYALPWSSWFFSPCIKYSSNCIEVWIMKQES